MMDIGFDTIGNATVICYDQGPILATDPWVQGSAYFGSWTHSHVIPEEQMTAILRSRFIWFSHGHPDHLVGTQAQGFVPDRWLAAGPFLTRVLVPVSGS